MHGTVSDKIYANAGNPDVVKLVGRERRTVLDVGCGAGANAALLRLRDPEKKVYGVTGAVGEAELARTHMERCWVADLERPLPDDLLRRRFDCIIFSHVLEHLRDPADLVRRLSDQLEPDGECVIALPNVLYWRERWDFVRGRFEYRASGTLDDTHLRFFTYYTAAGYLLGKAPALQVVERRVTGSVPLWILRRRLLSPGMRQWIDLRGCTLRPNLFGTQILIRAIRVA
jgi:2-polyprenyl-3-methyl-5-hydroxy-6-metoxy-1,4-benzoquinol methylase